jgi:DNA polymerase kappa
MDCDAFYAAVEELDRPELRDVPMAVGKGVITTCNYHARKFGCRSGMAGFVAMKLCPQLICLPLNFDKYSAKAHEVRAVLRDYDERFESASMDEAYLNITAYCKDNEMDPQDVVQQLRRQVYEQCKITVSAGIASNAKLAKIGSNKNKPNGQFYLPPDRATIIAFMRDLPVRKVNGVGRVFERELDAIGIKTCGDIYAHRAILSKLFGEKAFQFLIQCYLGLGRTTVAPAEEYERKSVGTESTFSEMEGKEAIRDKMRHIAEELEGDMKRVEAKGRTLVLKVKLHTYEVLTRQTVPPFALSKADDLYRFALPMLTKLENELPRLRLRLLGLRCTNLVSTAKTDVDFFGMQKRNSNATPKPATDADGWEIWPEAEFEEEAERERREDMAELERLSQEQEHFEKNEPPEAKPETPNEQFWDCPICQRPQPADERLLNEHIDTCLSRQTIRDVIKDTTETRESGAEKKPVMMVGGAGKKRGRSKTGTEMSEQKRNSKRKAFFS